MDHGILNIPLSKRGNIDAQIDAYKAQQAAQRKAERKATHAQVAADRNEAKSLIASMGSERLSALCLRFNLRPSVMLARLKSDAHWQPRLIIALLTRAEGR